MVGGGNRFTILWTSCVQLGAVRRSAQRSVVSYASLSRTIQSIQAQGGNILSIRTLNPCADPALRPDQSVMIGA